MPKKKKKAVVPRLRFPEFRDAGEWSIKKIDDYFDVRSSKRVLKKDWKEEGVPFYRTRELVSLSKNEPFRSEVYISEDLFSELADKYGLPVEGDFLVSGVGTLGIAFYVKAGDRFYFKDGNVLWLHRKENINSTFFRYSFESPLIQKQIKGSASISTVGTYTIEKARKTIFACPAIKEEQQKIADCLASLDDLIRAGEAQLVALKDHKKGLMQQLFPREGETTPRLRFPEFRDAGEWGVKRLGEVAAFHKGKGVSKSDISPDGVLPCIRYGELYTRYLETISDVVSHTNISSDDLLLSNANDVIIPASGETSEDIATASCVLHAGIALGGDLNIIRSSMNGVFLSYYLNSVKKHTIARIAQGNSVVHLYPAQLAKLELCIPSVIEQQKIADCLTSLDDLIRAGEAQLVALKDHKKGLMQQLFPQEVG